MLPIFNLSNLLDLLLPVTNEMRAGTFLLDAFHAANNTTAAGLKELLPSKDETRKEVK